MLALKITSILSLMVRLAMNRKQSKMLTNMRATKSQRAHWKTLKKTTKGKLRHFNENNPKMIQFGYVSSLSAISHG